MWIPQPASWGKSIVQGKSYGAEEAEGKALWAEVNDRLHLINAQLVSQLAENSPHPCLAMLGFPSPNSERGLRGEVNCTTLKPHQVEVLVSAIAEPPLYVELAERYREGILHQRLGQGAFRVLVTEAYDRRCASLANAHCLC
jgi:hypothetical protein